MKVYLVQSAQGLVMGVFASEEDAEFHRQAIVEAPGLPRAYRQAEVLERTLFHGRAPIRGYNE